MERALFIADVRHRQQPLPEGLIELESKRGMQLLKRSHHKTDLKPLGALLYVANLSQLLRGGNGGDAQ